MKRRRVKKQGRGSRAASRRIGMRHRALCVEQLEDRRLLATLSWVGDVDNTWMGGTSGFNTNWNTNTHPADGDRLVFPAGASNISNINDTPAGNSYLLFFTGSKYRVVGNSITLDLFGTDISNSGGDNTLSTNLTLAGDTTIDVNGGTELRLTGTLSGGALDSLDDGTLRVIGNSPAFNGTATVSAGTLQVDGDLSNANVTVETGATLAGNGVVGDVTVDLDGSVSPGDNGSSVPGSIGILTIAGNMTFAAQATFDVEMVGAGGPAGQGVNYDFLDVLGVATIESDAVLNLSGVYTASPGDELEVIQADFGIIGLFNNGALIVMDPAGGSSGAYDQSIISPGGGSQALRLTAIEPAEPIPDSAVDGTVTAQSQWPVDVSVNVDPALGDHTVELLRNSVVVGVQAANPSVTTLNFSVPLEPGANVISARLTNAAGTRTTDPANEVTITRQGVQIQGQVTPNPGAGQVVEVTNGTTSHSTATDSNGLFFFDGVAMENELVVVFLNNAGFRASTVFRTSSSFSVNTVELVENTVTLDEAFLTNVQLAAIDVSSTGDSDVGFDVSPSNSLATLFGTDLVIAHGTTFNPGGDVEVSEDLDLDGSLQLGSGRTLTVLDDFDASDATLLSGINSTVVLDGASSNVTWNSNVIFGNLEVGLGSFATFIGSTPLVVHGDFRVDGAVDMTTNQVALTMAGNGGQLTGSLHVTLFDLFIAEGTHLFADATVTNHLTVSSGATLSLQFNTLSLTRVADGASPLILQQPGVGLDADLATVIYAPGGGAGGTVSIAAAIYGTLELDSTSAPFSEFVVTSDTAAREIDLFQVDELLVSGGDLFARSVDVIGGTPTVTVASGRNLTLYGSGDVLPAAATLAAQPNSQVTYTGAGTVTVNDHAYDSLTLNNAAGTFDFGDTTIADTLTIVDGTAQVAPGATLSIGTALTVGTNDPFGASPNGTVLFGDSATVGSTDAGTYDIAFNDLAMTAGTLTFEAGISATVNGTTTADAGIVLTAPGAYDLGTFMSPGNDTTIQLQGTGAGALAPGTAGFDMRRIRTLDVDSASWTLTGPLHAVDLDQSGGTFDTDAFEVGVQSDLDQAGGTFDVGTNLLVGGATTIDGTLEITGSGSTIHFGDVTIPDSGTLRMLVDGSIVFEGGSTLSVLASGGSPTVHIDGATANGITLRAPNSLILDDTDWNVQLADPGGSYQFTDVRVMDSNASGTTVPSEPTADGTFTLTRTIDWQSAAAIAIATDYPDGTTISLARGGTVDKQATVSGGVVFLPIDSSLSDNDVVIIFHDTAVVGAQGAFVLRLDGTDGTGTTFTGSNFLTTGAVTVADEGSPGTAITRSDLITARGVLANVPYDAAAGFHTGIDLVIPADEAFTADGDVMLSADGDITNDGALTINATRTVVAQDYTMSGDLAGAGTLALTGDFTSHGGTVTLDTIRLDSAAPQSIQGSTAATIAVNNLTIAGAGTTTLDTTSDVGLSVAGTLTIESGAGDFQVAASETLTMLGTSMTIDDNTDFGSGGTGGTVVFDGMAHVLNGTATSVTFDELTVGSSASSLTISVPVTVNTLEVNADTNVDSEVAVGSQLDLANGNLTVGSTGHLRLQGSISQTAGTLTASQPGAQVSYEQASGSVDLIVPAGTNGPYDTLRIHDPDGEAGGLTTFRVPSNETITVADTLDLQAGTLDLLSDSLLRLSGAVTDGGLGAAMDASGTGSEVRYQQESGGPFTVIDGTYDTLMFDDGGSGTDWTLGSNPATDQLNVDTLTIVTGVGGQVDQNGVPLAINSDLTLVGNLIVDGDLDVNGNLNVNIGELDLSAPTGLLRISGDTSIAPGATWTDGSGLLRFDGSSQSLTDNRPVKGDLGAVEIAGSTVQLSSEIALTDLTILSGSALDAGSNDVRVERNWQNAGTFTSNAAASVVFESNQNGTLNPGGSPLSHLVVNKPGGVLTVAGAQLVVNSSTTVEEGTIGLQQGATFHGDVTVEIGGVMSATGAGTVLTFPVAAAGTVTVEDGGSFMVTGPAGEEIFLRSKTAGFQWALDDQTPGGGGFVPSFVEVRDSDASQGSTILASNSIDAGNNENWTFNPPAPPAPVITSMSMDTGPHTSDFVTNDSVVDFTGTAEVDSTVELLRNAVSIGTTTAIGGNWTINNVNLTEGSQVIEVTAANVTGTSPSTSQTVVLDTQAPATPGTPDLDETSDTGASNTDNVTTDRTPTFTGTAEAGSAVELISDTDGSLGVVTASPSGTWTLIAPLMSEATHSITATASDLAGNSATSAALVVTIEDPDFGDAPNDGPGPLPDYATLLADNGPWHVIDANIFMGATVDNELDGLLSAAANGDDTDQGLPDDEDGVLSPLDLLGTIGAQPAVTLLATNNTVSAATLFGWIDYNYDGVFDNVAERAQVDVPAGTSDGRLTLVFPEVPNGFTGRTYARFRLSSDAAAANPTGGAFNGEVEDYAFAITLPSGGAVDDQTKISDGTTGGLPAGSLDGGDQFGSALAALGDLDGDAITDIAVGAPLDDQSDADEGAVYVLLMHSDSTVKDQVKIGDGTIGGLTAGSLASGDRFGSAVAALGDLDANGVTDIVVGAPMDDHSDTDEGAVYVLLMHGDGTVKDQVKIGDGTTGGLMAGTLAGGDQFGSSVAALGDLDGDGVADIAVGASMDDHSDTDEGAVYVLLMHSDGTVKDQVKIGDGTTGGLVAGTLAGGDQFGSSVAALGDLDGDGVVDMAVGASLDDHSGTDEGAVYVLLMHSDGTVKGQVKIGDGLGGLTVGTLGGVEHFGSSVAALGDLNGDGVHDLAVGAQRDENLDSAEGAVYVLLMQSDGTVKIQLKISDGTAGGLVDGTLDADDRFGSSVAALGDLDGDGVAELAVGAAEDEHLDAGEGAVYVLNLLVQRPGDMDLDGDVDLDDVTAFVLGLTDEDAYEEMFGVPAAYNGDMDQDGDLDLDDVDGFVALLTGGGGGQPSGDEPPGDEGSGSGGGGGGERSAGQAGVVTADPSGDVSTGWFTVTTTASSALPGRSFRQSALAMPEQGLDSTQGRPVSASLNAERPVRRLLYGGSRSGVDGGSASDAIEDARHDIVFSEPIDWLADHRAVRHTRATGSVRR